MHKQWMHARAKKQRQLQGGKGERVDGEGRRGAAISAAAATAGSRWEGKENGSGRAQAEGKGVAVFGELDRSSCINNSALEGCRSHHAPPS